jgi:arsenate reductase
MIRPKVLFLCSDNSCRTQMAEAFLRDMAGEHFEVLSAGAEATALDPEAVAAMDEVGLDISGQTPKRGNLFMGEPVAYLVTLCDREIERRCPIFPGTTWRMKWPAAGESPLSAKPRGSARPDPDGYAMKSGRMSSGSLRNTHKERQNHHTYGAVDCSCIAEILETHAATRAV